MLPIDRIRNSPHAVKKETSFAIGIPTINRTDLLIQALSVYKTTMRGVRIFIQNNGSEAIGKIKGDKNLGVAASWNKLCRSIFQEHSHALLLNDDVILGMDKKGIEDFISRNTFDMAVSANSSSVILLPKETFELVDTFDEQFYPGYFEDNDYFYRVKLKKKVLLRSAILNPAVYRESMSGKKDRRLLDNFKMNRDRYKKKWGGNPGDEKYAAPYKMNHYV